jgi:hypothetical protein
MVLTLERAGLIRRTVGGPRSIEILWTLNRNQIVELESLEATGVATPETCEMLVDLHNLLDKLYAMLLGHAGKTLQ